MASDLASIADPIRIRMDALDDAREFCYKESRRIVRESASAIRLLHQGRFDEASVQVRETEGVVRELLDRTAREPLLAASGFILDSVKEHVEAHITKCLITGRDLPTPEDLCVPDGPYLNGIAEAVMETRRHLVDLIRLGRMDEAAEKLDRAEDIYFTLTSFDYPDAVSLGLKRRLDTVRSILERTRSDLVTASRQASLEARLASLEESLPDL